MGNNSLPFSGFIVPMDEENRGVALKVTGKLANGDEFYMEVDQLKSKSVSFDMNEYQLK